MAALAAGIPQGKCILQNGLQGPFWFLTTSEPASLTANPYVKERKVVCTTIITFVLLINKGLTTGMPIVTKPKTIDVHRARHKAREV
jgi:hypothetical protein